MAVQKVSICSYNVNGLGDRRKRHEIFAWLKDKPYQIFCLQETHSTVKQEEFWQSDWGGPALFNHGLSNSRGVLILFKNNISYTIHQTLSDDSGRWMVLDITLDSTRFCLANIYAPNTDDPDFFFNLETTIHNHIASDLHTIIVGDFNTTLNSELDRAGHRSSVYHPNSRNAINSICANLDLLDIFRYNYPSTVRYTWRRRRQASRIDYFLISFSLTSFVDKVVIEDSLRSDHSLIGLSVITSKIPRGRGFWRMNQDFLSDKTFIKETSEFITEFFQFNVNSANPHIVWESFKCSVRGHIIKFTSWKRKQTKDSELALSCEIVNLQKDLDTCFNIDTFHSLNDKKQQLELLYQAKANNMIRGKRAKWMEQGEKCTKLFMNMISRGNSRKNMTKFVTTEGLIKTDPQEILVEQVNFFSALYSFKEPPISLECDAFESFFPNPPHVSLSLEQRKSCDGLITERELRDSIESFSSGRAPGLDGLPVEFYKVFFNLVKKPMLDSFNYSYRVGHLSNTQKTGLISLLLKQDSTGQDKDPSQIKNWRPLTLLNCDSRILSKCIALRMKQIIPHLISSDQTGFLQGRCISDSIRRILEIIEYYDRNSLPGLIFVADFEKAFDTIRLDFIFKTLEYFGFGAGVINWIRILYKDICSMVINYGHISHSFPLSRGVRQGCPLSPYLFILGVEILAIKIRNNVEIKGLTTYGVVSKISQYADDCNFPLAPKLGSLYALVTDLENFSSLSGLTPNFDKCIIKRIGSLCGTNFCLPCPLPVQWTDGPIDLLGIHIPVLLSDIIRINFDRKLMKIDKLLYPWKTKILTLMGKITLINTLIVTQFIFLLSSLSTPPPDFFDKYEKKIFEFLWGGGPERIKRKTIYSAYEQGGLKLRNLRAVDLTLKASWVPKLQLNKEWFCSKFLFMSCPLFRTSLFPFAQLTSCDFDNLLGKPAPISSFFKQVIQAWLRFQLRPPEGVEEIKQQILCLNSKIRIAGKPFFSSSFDTAGVRFLNDILDSENKLLSYTNFSLKFGNTCPEFQYIQLTSAIPVYWKSSLKHPSPDLRVCMPICRDRTWCQKKKINKYLYIFFMKETNLCEPSYKIQLSWEEYFDIPIPWKQVYCLPYKLSIDTHTRMFQYKLLFKFLTVNKTLFTWKLINSPRCSLCNEEEETVIHLFWDCRVVANFWSKVDEWFFNLTNIHLHINVFNVIFGDLSDRCPALSNLIILLAKIYIFKYRQQKLELSSFISFVSYVHKLECIIAKRLDKMPKHIGKWGKLYVVLI